ncbi:MAG: sigma 54-interacting transcriptional regulator [bacterium]|jgi:two-component system response regulator HupR/HoxA
MDSRDLVYASDHMRFAVETAKQVAYAPVPVLIEGESGTGKELIARLIHSSSPRSDGPFIAVNCGAIPHALFESEVFGHTAGAFTGAHRARPGLFETAAGGTLFLDEIGELSPAMQAKLLRVLQEGCVRRVGEDRSREFDVRVVAATNKELEMEMRAGRFREDLFFRISVVRIFLEPLRTRKDDVLALLKHFARKHAVLLGKHEPRFAGDVPALFTRYPWPGNVRELENEVQRLVVLASDGKPISASKVSRRIRKGALTAENPAAGSALRERVESFEREVIKETLDRYGWNKTRAARYLGITRQGLHRKLRKLRISRMNGVDPAPLR